MSVSKPSSDDSCVPFASSPFDKVCQLWRAYLLELQHRPVRTKAITSASFAALATLIAQWSVGVPKYDFTAVRNQAIIGFIRGPTMHYWMEALNKLFFKLGYTTPQSQLSTEVVIGKMALDQFLFAPLHMLYYMRVIGWLEGRPSADVMAKISNDFLPVMMMNWKVWPIVSLLNFKLVPPQLRVLTLNIVGCAWMVYLIKKLSQAAVAAAKAAK